MKSKISRSLPMFFIVLMLVSASVASAQEEDILWQGHTLAISRISTDNSEISALYTDPIPAQGYLALLLLDTLDGTPITGEELESHAKDFLLTDAEGNVTRPMESVPQYDGHDIGLVFYVRSDETDSQELRLSVQPHEKIPDAILNAELDWQDRQLIVVSSTADRAALNAVNWPDNGYMINVSFRTKDESLILGSRISAYDYEIVLTDGKEYYMPSKAYYTSSAEGTDYFVLSYTIQGDSFPALDDLALAVRPSNALWLYASARGAAAAPFAQFSAQSPEARTIALALEDSSKFAYNSVIAAKNPQKAFEDLDTNLREIRSDLRALLGNSVTFSDDPDLASVVIGIDIQYPSAGRFGTTGSINAYNCTLLLTAYDANTHEPIAQLETGNYYGSSISVSQGTTVVWKKVPALSAAKQEDQEAFASALQAFWE